MGFDKTINEEFNSINSKIHNMFSVNTVSLYANMYRSHDFFEQIKDLVDFDFETFKDMLDPAVARRFTFKVELDYLDVDGRCVFWKRFFGSEPRGKIRNRLNGLDRLTPGDFRTVRQELYYLGDDVSDDDRLDALEAELSAKTGVTRRIGFSE